MELSFENDGDTLVMRKDFRVLCRVRAAVTDIGMEEQLSGFVARHGGIDAVLDYMRRCVQNGERVPQ